MFTRQSDVRKRGHVVPMFTRQSYVGERFEAAKHNLHVPDVYIFYEYE